MYREKKCATPADTSSAAAGTSATVGGAAAICAALSAEPMPAKSVAVAAMVSGAAITNDIPHLQARPSMCLPFEICIAMAYLALPRLTPLRIISVPHETPCHALAIFDHGEALALVQGCVEHAEGLIDLFATTAAHIPNFTKHHRHKRRLWLLKPK